MSDAKTTKNRGYAGRRQLGRRLRSARRYLGLKQEDVALYLMIRRSTLSDLEHGRRQVSTHELARLANLYRQQADYFTGKGVSTATLPADVAPIARQATALSRKDHEELVKFSEYLQARSQSSRG